MSKKFKYIAVLIGIFLLTNDHLLADENDSIRQISSLSSEKILNLKTNWNNSSNAAGLQFFDIQNKIATAYINFNRDKGDFHRYKEENKLKKIGFYTNGYVKLNKWKFYGDFNYYGSKNIGINWVNVLDPYNYNPYTLGDSVGGTYHKEFFNMRTKAAWEVTDKLVLGFNIKYKTGVGARRKDPRPVNITTTFDISPSLIFNLNKVKIGANFIYQGSKEDIELETVTDSIYSFFHFKGMGVYSSSTELDERSSESDLIGGGVQFNFSKGKIDNLSEINFSRKATDIKRGETYPLQIVLLENYSTDITSTFLFHSENKTINKLEVFFNDKHIYGHEPVIEPQLIKESYQWSTVEKYTLYWFQENQYGFNYSYYKIRDKNHINWGTTFNAKISTSESKYYFVPEKNQQELNYFTFNTKVEKEFISNVANIILSAGGGIQKGFTSSFDLINDDSLLENVNTQFVKHDFDYFNEQMIEFTGEINVGKEVQIYNSLVQLFLTADYCKQFSQMPGNPKRTFINLQFGINF